MRSRVPPRTMADAANADRRRHGLTHPRARTLGWPMVVGASAVGLADRRGRCADADDGGAGGGLNDRLTKRPSEARPHPRPDRLLRWRHQRENVAVVRRRVHWRRLVCPTIFGKRGSTDDGRAVRVVIRVHDHILDEQHDHCSSPLGRWAGGDVVSVSGCSSGLGRGAGGGTRRLLESRRSEQVAHLQ